MFMRYAVFVLALFTAGYAAASQLDAQAYYIGHPETGTVIDAHNADEQMPPASLTKLMTLYLVFEALEDGRLSLETELPISKKAWRKGGSKMFLEVGKTVKAEDLLRGIAVQSGNDACIVAAEYLAGTEEAFAVLMNEKAAELGMKNSVFRNASGWPHPEQLTTARDMYLLASAILRDFPSYYSLFSIPEFTYSDIRQYNRNGLLGRQGVDGMKTGHVEDAGYHLVTSAQQGDVRLVSVLMGAESDRKRERQSLLGLSQAFVNYDYQQLVREGTPIASEIPVWQGTQAFTDLVALQDANIFVDKRQVRELDFVVRYAQPLMAPLAAGQPVAALEVRAPDGTVVQSVPLGVRSAIAQEGFFSRLVSVISHNIGL